MNISPRIYKATAGTNINDASFANIELITEKTCEYWLENPEEEAQIIKPDYASEMVEATSKYTQYSDEWYCYIWGHAEVNVAMDNCAPYLGRVNNAVAMVRGSTMTT